MMFCGFSRVRLQNNIMLFRARHENYFARCISLFKILHLFHCVFVNLKLKKNHHTARMLFGVITCLSDKSLLRQSISEVQNRKWLFLPFITKTTTTNDPTGSKIQS